MNEAGRLVDRLTALALASYAIVMSPFVLRMAAPAWFILHPALAEVVRAGVAGLTSAALVLCLAGLAGTKLLVGLRHPAPRTGRAARWPQALIVVPSAVACGALAWHAHLAIMGSPASPDIGFAVGAGAMVLAFPLLVAERFLAGTPAVLLPEAAGLRGLFFLATATLFSSGLLEILAAAGLPGQRIGGTGIAAVLVAAAAELGLRSGARLFLPPPRAEQAVAACTALVATLVSSGVAKGSFAAPIRQHFGIDFSRSWALGYLRSAFMPLVAGLLLLAWGLSGVVIVRMEARAVYERFGAPVRVLHPGLHVVLPWPMSATRFVEFGTVHALRLAGDEGAQAAAIAAEDPAPVAADRLWEQAHPGELALLVASAGTTQAARQSFQSVSADLRLLYRVGVTDRQAIAATYAAADPQNLVRSLSGRAIASYFAARTLADALGADREAVAGALQATIQAALDQAGSGIDLVAVNIEAIHPPAGAAAAYHGVRAAEIASRTSVASEQGRAIVVRSQSQQYAAEQRANATAAAAEMVGAAQGTATSFAADRQAAQTGRAFLLERYFTDLVAALAKTPMTIIDHRLAAPDAPVLDLRPLAGATQTDTKGE